MHYFLIHKQKCIHIKRDKNGSQSVLFIGLVDISEFCLYKIIAKFIAYTFR